MKSFIFKLNKAAQCSILALLASGGGYTQNGIALSPPPYVQLNSVPVRPELKRNPVKQVDSIAATSGPLSGFALMYSRTMQEIDMKLQTKDSVLKVFIEKFEYHFADYFLDGCFASEKNLLSDSSEWKCFFANPEAKSWQLVVLGVNAHTNCNIWQTLVTHFSEKEIVHNKKQLLRVEPAIDKVCFSFFDTVLQANHRLRMMHVLTLGLDKKFAGHLVYKWRRRNVQLAVLYFRNPKRFQRKLAAVNCKKKKIDRIVLNS
jgi:hypothetical protein